MKRRQRTEITVETERILIIRQGNGFRPAWCPQCAAQVRMVTPEEAAILAGSTLRAICRQVEADLLHFNETDDGRLFICLNSLPETN